MQQPTGAPTAPSRTAVVYWRCPQCGFIFAPEPTTVRCPRCGENLRKCRYCRFADTVTWECLNNRIRFTFGDETGRMRIPEPDHFWACPENLPNLQPAVWQVAMLNPLTRALTWGAITAVALLIAFRLFIFPLIAKPEMPETALITGTLVLSRTQFAIGEEIPLLLVITNAERVPLDPCVVVLRGELIREAEVRSQPPPLYPPQRTPESVRLFFPGLPAQQTFTAWVYITPIGVSRGNYEVRVEVFCGGYRGVVTPPSVPVQIR